MLSFEAISSVPGYAVPFDVPEWLLCIDLTYMGESPLLRTCHRNMEEDCFWPLKYRSLSLPLGLNSIVSSLLTEKNRPFGTEETSIPSGLYNSILECR